MKLIDLFIIIGIVIVAFFGYQKYFEEQELDKNFTTKDVDVDEYKNLADDNVAKESVQKENNFENKIKDETELIKTKILNNEDVVEKKGFYENKKYYYEISFPEDWPLKVRSDENISIGTVIPKNGYGAITIEISKDGEAEIEEVKKEAEKYSNFIKINEEDIFLSGIKGSKLVLDNKVNNIKNIYIILEKNNIYYALKYTEESKDFVLQVEKILNSFKFIR